MSLVVRVDLSRLPAAFQALGPRLMVAAHRGAMSGALRAVSTLHRATSTAKSAVEGLAGVGGAVNTGYYKRAWKAEKTPDGARVYNAAPYAAIIEHGRRAGSRMPPPDVMVAWARRRLGLSEKEARRAAFPLARAIARRGLRPRHVLKGSLPQIEQDFWEEVTRELMRELTGRRP